MNGKKNKDISSASRTPLASNTILSHQQLYAGELAILQVTQAMAASLSKKAPSVIFALDEVGRGCLAGEVVTGLSMWIYLAQKDEHLSLFLSEQDAVISGVRDSKKLTEKARDRLFTSLYQQVNHFNGDTTDSPLQSVEARPSHLSAQVSAQVSAQGGGNAPRLKILPSSTELGLAARPIQFVEERTQLHYGETTAFEKPHSRFFAAAISRPQTLGFQRVSSSPLFPNASSLPAAPEGFIASPSAKERSNEGSNNGGEDENGKAESSASLLLTGLYVTSATAVEIDALGIWGATELSMSRALLAAAREAQALLSLESLKDVAEETLVLVDGDRCLRYPELFVPGFEAVVVKGDLRLKSIGAASIVAKVARDDLMVAMAEKYPGYGFEQHSAYGTKAHYDALKLLGPSPIHRRSFRLS